MAITNFIPELWSAQILQSFSETAIAANLANREYEGVATRGNTVHIAGVVDVEIRDYKAAGRTTTADAITDTGQELLIDQEKSFDFYVDDIDRAQAAGSLEAYTESAARGLAQDADLFLFALAAAADENPLTGSVSSGDQAHDVVRDLRKKLNRAHVPQGSRALFVNAEFEAYLLGADSKLSSVDTSGTSAGLRDAAIGRLLGFTVYTTENLPKTDTPMAVAVYLPAWAYVSQIEEIESLRSNDRFADRLRGLHVYGGKIVRPEGVAVYDPDAGSDGGVEG